MFENLEKFHIRLLAEFRSISMHTERFFVGKNQTPVHLELHVVHNKEEEKAQRKGNERKTTDLRPQKSKKSEF